MTARILADFGAEVIKVEPPRKGDELREWGTMIPTCTGIISAWWLSQARVAHHEELDEIVGAWVAAHTLAQPQAILDEAGVPAGPVMRIADIAADPHYQARDMLLQVPDERLAEGVAIMPGIVPHLTETPGGVTHSGGEPGPDNHAVYAELLGLSPTELEQLKTEGVI